MPDVFLRMLYKRIKEKFTENGGWTSKRNLGYIVILMYAVYSFMKVRGYLPKKNLKGKHVFLTGAGSGLGRQLSIQLAKLGCNLSISDLVEPTIQETKRLVGVATGRVDNVNAMCMDVSNRALITKCARKAEQTFGPVDIIINNAGVVQARLLTEADDRKIHQTMVINGESHIWIIKEFLQSMMDRNSGHIVCVSSMAGICGGAGLTDYCASKFFAYTLNESLRVEMRHLGKNIAVTTVCPYYIDTGMFDGAKADWLWPLLKQEWVTSRIIQAIQQEEGEVNIYWLQAVLIYLCKTVMTSSCFDWTLWILNGFDGVLVDFRGRQGANDPLALAGKAQKQ